MMNAMTVTEAQTGSVTIGFVSQIASKKAEWAQAADNGPSRKFFGVSPAELEMIIAQNSAPENATRALAVEVLRGLLGFGK